MACAQEPASPYVDAYCEALRVENNASAHTIRAYRTDLNDFTRWSAREGYDILTMDHRLLRLYLADLDQARYTRTTINRRLSSLKGFYRWLNATDVIETDPAGILQGAKRAKHLPHVIRPEDMAKLLSVYGGAADDGRMDDRSPSDIRNRALLEFLYACGARISEASDLLLSQVYFDSKQVKVFGKGSKERIIPLHDMALHSMRDYLRRGRPLLLEGKSSEYFFVSDRGKHMSADVMRKVFKKAVRTAGLDETLSPHDMRHTFATDVLAGGADLRSVQEMLGHASLSSTQVYTHLSPAHLKEVHEKAHPRSERV